MRPLIYFLFSFGVLILSPLILLAQPNDYKVLVKDIRVEGALGPKMEQKAIALAIESVTSEEARKLLGVQLYEENRHRLKKEILTRSKHFISSFEILEKKRIGDIYIFKVQVRLSTQDFRFILQKGGFLSGQNTSGIVLPFVEFNHQVLGEVFRWWSPFFVQKKSVVEVAGAFEKAFSIGFFEKGFFLLSPVSFSMIHMVPGYLRRAFLSKKEMADLTRFKKGQIFITGFLNILESPLENHSLRIRLSLSAWQVKGGGRVTQVIRSYDMSGSATQDQLILVVNKLALEGGREMAQQIFNLWQSGSLQSQVLRLVVTGSLSHQDLLDFKKNLKESIKGVRSVRERLYEPNRLTFEVDYREGGMENFEKKLKGFRFKNFISQLVSRTSSQVILDLR